jgi:hypothetical protein
MRTAADLQISLDTSCDSDEYKATRKEALLMLAIWPVGTPVVYAMLLFASRKAIFTDIPTPLSRATHFLSADYKPEAYLWEPMEMCRKLTLTGETLSQAEVARVHSGLHTLPNGTLVARRTGLTCLVVARMGAAYRRGVRASTGPGGAPGQRCVFVHASGNRPSQTVLCPISIA